MRLTRASKNPQTAQEGALEGAPLLTAHMMKGFCKSTKACVLVGKYEMSTVREVKNEMLDCDANIECMNPEQFDRALNIASVCGHYSKRTHGSRHTKQPGVANTNRKTATVVSLEEVVSGMARNMRIKIMVVQIGKSSASPCHQSGAQCPRRLSSTQQRTAQPRSPCPQS